jgi:putative endonuclease
MSDRRFFVYIMANKANNVLYTGVTNNLRRRIQEHREGTGGSFTQTYQVSKLVYFELYDDARYAIDREKQIKGDPLQKKIDLVNSMNPAWLDLYTRLPIDR